MSAARNITGAPTKLFYLGISMRVQMRLFVIGVVAVLFTFVSWGTRADGRSAFAAADLLRLQRVSDVQVSPDGHYAVFALTQADVGMNQNHTHMWLLDLTRKAAPTR
jgi:hypothetical protein